MAARIKKVSFKNESDFIEVLYPISLSLFCINIAHMKYTMQYKNDRSIEVMIPVRHLYLLEHFECFII